VESKTFTNLENPVLRGLRTVMVTRHIIELSYIEPYVAMISGSFCLKFWKRVDQVYFHKSLGIL